MSCQLRTLSEIGVATTPIFGKTDLDVGGAVVVHNVATFNPAFARHLDTDVYVARTAHLQEVALVDLPPGALVHGGADFVTTVGEAFIEEQLPPWLRGDGVDLNRARAIGRPVIEISEPALLVARFGGGTWGHWLGELLPKIVLAELAAPGKFHFVIPAAITDPNNPAAMARNVLGSLAAYGVGPERLIRVTEAAGYRFSQLSSISSVWSDHMLHPEVAKTMRERLERPLAGRTAPAAYLLRNDARRAIINAGEVATLATAAGFEPVDIAGLDFLEQVAVFESAERVLSVLGSSLTGLIYSPPSVRVASLAPGDWGDRFFFALVQLQRGAYVDVRGEPEIVPGRLTMASPFRVHTGFLKYALERLAAAVAA